MFTTRETGAWRFLGQHEDGIIVHIILSKWTGSTSQASTVKRDKNVTNIDTDN